MIKDLVPLTWRERSELLTCYSQKSEVAGPKRIRERREKKREKKRRQGGRGGREGEGETGVRQGGGGGGGEQGEKDDVQGVGQGIVHPRRSPGSKALDEL